MAQDVGIRLSEELVNEIIQEDQIQPAVYEFNHSPKRGITRLCAALRIPEEPEAIAHVFHTLSGLLTSQIGEFLSRQANRPILTAFFAELDLTGPFLLQMRKAIQSNLRLPAEGEKIDRILEGWASAWVRCNPDCGIRVDDAHVLAYAALLLNGDLHNPVSRTKMTRDQFIASVRITLQQSEYIVPDSVLDDIYQSIAAEKFAFKEHDDSGFMALTAPKLKGTLRKKSDAVFSKWTQHYFVLTNSSLYYFRNSHELSQDSPQGMVELVGVSIGALGDDTIVVSSVQNALTYVKFSRKGPQLVRTVRSMFLRARSTTMRDKWLYRIRTSSVYSQSTGQSGVPFAQQDLPTDISEAASQSNETGYPSSDTEFDGLLLGETQVQGTVCPDIASLRIEIAKLPVM
jgi:hypothetical protein